MIKIGLMGDVMIGRVVNEKLNGVHPSYLWGNILPILKSNDFNLINLEAALTTSEKEVYKVFNFKADPDKVNVLKEGNIHAVNIANNHILDYDIEGLKETIQVLDAHHILHTGAGNSLKDASKPIITEVKGLKIGIIGFTDNEPTWRAKEKHPGTNYVEIDNNGLKIVQAAIQKIRAEVDLLIITMHWGPNMRLHPIRSFVQFAQGVIDAGADVFHGHSAHVFQRVEKYNQGVILYDTGDFVDDYAVDPFLRNDHSFLFILEVEKKGIVGLKLIPTTIEACQVNQSTGEELEETLERMVELSEVYGTQFIKENFHLYLPFRC